jgi:transposase
LPDRKCLAGILFVLRTGLPSEDLPAELGCGAGVTCWRRLRDWHHAGVWRRLQHELLNRLRDADAIDWSRASVDASLVPAKGGRQDRHGSALTPLAFAIKDEPSIVGGRESRMRILTSRVKITSVFLCTGPASPPSSRQPIAEVSI